MFRVICPPWRLLSYHNCFPHFNNFITLIKEKTIRHFREFTASYMQYASDLLPGTPFRLLSRFRRRRNYILVLIRPSTALHVVAVLLLVVAHLQLLSPRAAGPALGAIRVRELNGSEEGVIATSRAPRQSCTAPDRQMVQAKSDPGESDAHDGAEKYVEAMVPVVEPAGGGDEGCDAQGYEHENEQINWGSCSFVSNRDPRR